MDSELKELGSALEGTLQAVQTAVQPPRRPAVRESGVVKFVGEGVARIEGLPGVKYEEVVRFPGDRHGLAFNLDPEEVGVVLLDESEQIESGMEVRRTHRVLDVPVGEALLGRIVDGVGRPRDGKGPIRTEDRLPVEREAPAIMDRSAVNVPLQTGVKVVDALIPIGRGQRELIVGDRQTGKTAIAVDAILNQRETGVKCIYCAIGLRSSSIARVVRDLEDRGAMEYCTVLATTEEDPPGLRYVAPFAAMSMGEYYRDNGQDALVILDDLTRHARAYREISLLMRRPPGREAFPGDIFYLHSRLLERSTHLREDEGGGSLTCLPVVETEAQNISAYIPTNVISITDGQIYLSPDLFHKGIMPAVDVGRSVSRVGGKTQLPAYRAVAGDLRISYSQFEELESFSRFGTRLDEDTRRRLERGRRVREILKQNQYEPLSVPAQIASLLAVTSGALDETDLDTIADAEQRIQETVTRELTDICDKIEAGQKLSDEDSERVAQTVRNALPERS